MHDPLAQSNFDQSTPGWASWMSHPDVEAFPLAACWMAKQDKPLLVFHKKCAHVRCCSHKRSHCPHT